MRKKNVGKAISLSLIAAMAVSGCKSPETYRKDADKAAYDLIHQTEKELFDRESVFSIESPEDQLRRRVFEAQGLQTSGEFSLGIENLSKPELWPEKDYPAKVDISDNSKYAQPIKISLLDALQMAAAHNFSYQQNKESVFSTALQLDLQEHYFENIYSGNVSNSVSASTSYTGSDSAVLSDSVDGGVSRRFKNGTRISASIGYAIAKMLTFGHDSSHSTAADASVTVPLLRGSGEFITTEGLTQAQRNLVYAIYNFERYKKSFAISIANSYYNVLRIHNQILNAEANYKSLKTSADRSRDLADAGRMTNIQRDQAIQGELSARNSWLSSQETYKTAVDTFKILLGLPTDAQIELDTSELDKVVAYTEKALNLDLTPAREDKVIFNDIPGPFEIDENRAVKYALENRLDLKNSKAEIYDSQRSVIILADQLRAELSLGGSAQYGLSPDNDLDIRDGNYSAFLTLDLPLDRVQERNNYRNSLLSLRRAVRSCQSLEDDIKLNIRSELRDLKDKRNSLQIQAESVRLAGDRVRSASMFMDAGRAQMRDLLEAENSLLNAKNNITSSVIAYRMAELQLQRDMGLLGIDEKGLWHEFNPQAAAEADNQISKSETGNNNQQI